MAKQTINIGTSPNSTDGDPLRNAFTKINENFDELYAGNFADPAAVGSALKPDTDATYDLGASDKQWADLYVRDFIYLNGVRLEGANGNLLVEGATITADSQGSVFGDDSTLLVDAVNNIIPTSVLQGDITNPIRTGNVIIESTTSPGSVTITHAGIGGITIDASTSGDGISLEGDVSVEGSFTPPMLTQAEIDALTPTLGMMVYNTTTGKFQGYAADANNDSTTGWADLH